MTDIRAMSKSDLDECNARARAWRARNAPDSEQIVDQAPANQETETELPPSDQMLLFEL